MQESIEGRWLLLIHQIPPKPNYFRVKIWRRLQRLGAVAVKNSVYVLPKTDQAQEDFQWILREIVEGGGQADIHQDSHYPYDNENFHKSKNAGYTASKAYGI